MRHFYYLLAFILGFGFIHLNGQVVINEACSNNETIFFDEYGEASDWIELYNAGSSSVDLSGWSLSDDITVPQKWFFPANARIEAGRFLLVVADRRDEFSTYHHTSFGLSANGDDLVLYAANGEVIDRRLLPDLNDDQSIGRTNGNRWGIYSSPTPGAANANVAVMPISRVPIWDAPGGVTPGATIVKLINNETNGSIYYTLDGSQPSPENGEIYQEAFTLTEPTVVRARCFVDGQLPSDEIFRSYFPGLDHALPIVSLIAEPDELLGEENGILVPGPNASPEFPFYGANFWEDIEIGAYFEYLEDGEIVVSQAIETKVHGGRGARTNPQKPLRLLFKNKLGAASTDYPFFAERPEGSRYKRLVLRNASGDHNYLHFRDAFLARYFMREKLDLDVLAHRPTVVYLNGDYYGIMNLREKTDRFYLDFSLDINQDNVDLLEEDSIVIEGDFAEFDRMYQYVIDHDLSDPAHFAQANRYFDSENIAEGFIVQTGLNNTDWLHNNIKYYRERTDTARWRYITFDLDIAMSRHGWTLPRVNSFEEKMTIYQDTNRHVNIFKAFLVNEDYRHYFLNRYADLFNDSFRPEIFREEVFRTADEIDPEMPRHKERWPDNRSYQFWLDSRIPAMLDFVAQRPDFARQQLVDYFNLPGTFELALKTVPSAAGTFKVNTLEPTATDRWDGIYFQDVPVELTALPAPGYRFSHWGSLRGLSEDSLSIKTTFTGDDEVVAYYTKIGSDPVPNRFFSTGQAADEQIQLFLQLDDRYQVEFGLIDVLGRELWAYPSQIFNGGESTFSLSLPEIKNGIYFIRTRIGEQDYVTRFLFSN